MNKAFLVLLFLFISKTLTATCSYTQQSLIDAQSKCQSKTGYYWDCESNRCVMRGDAFVFKKTYLECSQKENDEQRKACHDAVARQFSEQEGIELLDGVEKHKFEKKAKIMAGLQVFHVIMASAVSKSGSNCAPMQMYKASAMIGLSTELSNHFYLKDKTEKLQKQYLDEVTQTHGYDAQQRSFEYLAVHHEMIAQTAKQKKKGYLTVFPGYAGTSVVAAMNAFAQPDPCMEGNPGYNGEETSGQNGSAPVTFQFNQKENWYLSLIRKIDESKKYFLVLESFFKAEEVLAEGDFKRNDLIPIEQEQAFIQEQQAESQQLVSQGMSPIIAGLGSMGADGGAIGAQAYGSEQSTQKNWLSSSALIAVISGASATIAWKLYKHFKEVEEIASKNAIAIRELGKRFMEMAAGECKIHNDPTKPLCYCYNIDGTVNNENKEKEMCVEHFKSLQGNLDVAGATNFDLNDGLVPYGCVDSQSNFDRNCDCEKVGSCLRTNITTELGELGKNFSANSLKIIGNDLTRGKLAGAGLSSENLLNLAAKARDEFKEANQQIKGFIKSHNKKNKDNPLVDFTSSKLRTAAVNEVATKNLVSAVASSATADKSLSKAKKLTGINNYKRNYNRARSNFMNNPKSSNSLALKFKKRNRRRPSSKVQTFNSKTGKKYNYSKGEIHTNNGVSLWKIISKRYFKATKTRLVVDIEL